MGQVIPVLRAMRGQRVYVDTNVFIYFLERNVQFFAAAVPVIEALSNRDVQGYTGEITVAEAMVGPYRSNDAAAISHTRNFFTKTGLVTLLPHDRVIFDHAAQLRAQQRLPFIDAIHVATAVEAACKFFITNDKALRTTGTLGIIQLDTLHP